MTRKLIEDLILQFTGSTDVLGVPFFNEEMVTIWSSKTRRLHQDKENLPLYSNCHYLPSYSCARESNSLESFHLHFVNFVRKNLSMPSKLIFLCVLSQKQPFYFLRYLIYTFIFQFFCADWFNF